MCPSRVTDVNSPPQSPALQLQKIWEAETAIMFLDKAPGLGYFLI